MKTLSPMIVASLALCASAAAAPKPTATTTAAAEDSTQRLTVPLSDPARAATLRVGLIHGSITVKGSNRKDVLVEVHPRGRDDGEERSPEANGLRRLSQPSAFTVEEENNRVEVTSSDHRSA